jgi:hypothetical protein
MDRLFQAQGRFARVGRGDAAAGVPDRTDAASTPGTPSTPPTPATSGAPDTGDRPITGQLEALALAAMALGWECVQAADERGVEPYPDLDAEGLSPAMGPGSGRPGSSADWERFDAAWRRVRRELRAHDLIGVGLALIDFAQACRITADRLAVGEPAARPHS